MPGTERLLQGVASGMIAQFAFVDFSVAEKPADIRVVLAQLADAARRGEIIDPAVAEMGEIHPARREPREAESRPHPGAFIVALAEMNDGLVDLLDEFREDVIETRGKTN